MNELPTIPAVHVVEGVTYLVFNTEHESATWFKYLPWAEFACFNGYMNALKITKSSQRTY